jgi:hypothetical protein
MFMGLAEVADKKVTGMNAGQVFKCAQPPRRLLDFLDFSTYPSPIILADIYSNCVKSGVNPGKVSKSTN